MLGHAKGSGPGPVVGIVLLLSIPFSFVAPPAAPRAPAGPVAASGFAVNLSVSTNPLENGSYLQIFPYLSGANGTVSFQWSGLPAGCGPSTHRDIDCLPGVGVYPISLTVTDAAGATANASVVLHVVPALHATFAITVLGNCTNATAAAYELTIADGVPPYQTAWHLANGTVLTGSVTAEVLPAPNGIPVLEYVTVQDAEGALLEFDANAWGYVCEPPSLNPPPTEVATYVPGAPPLVTPGEVTEVAVVGILLFGIVAAAIVVLEDADRRRRRR